MPPPEDPAPEAVAWRPGIALTAWAVLAVAFGVLQAEANAWGVGLRRWPPSASLLAGWVQFDGPEYLHIATRGYEQRQLVWFPLYPLLIRLVDTAVGSPVVSAVAVSAVAGAAAAALYWRWLGLRVPSAAARACGLAVLLLYPYGWFQYGVVYSDAVFLALVLGAFVLVEQDRYLAAGLVTAFATATRPSGFAVLLGVAAVALDRSGVLVADDRPGWAGALRLPTTLHPERFRPAVAAPLVGVTGLVVWCGYQWVAWGSPLRFVSEQANYHDTGAATYLKRQYFEAFYQGFDGRHLATTTAQLVLLVVVLLSVPAVGRRFGWGYGVFVLGLAVFPALSVSTFMGVGRYLLPAFPAFALAGEWLARRRVARTVWFTVCPVLLTVMVFGYARSWYLT